MFNLCGLFANHLGYGIVIIEFNKDKFKIVDVFESKIPSMRCIVKELENFLNEYKFSYLYMNKNNQLEKILKGKGFDPQIKDINIVENIFTILAMYNDKDLSIDKWVEDNMKKALNDFVIDEEYEHHLVQALFLSMEFSLCNIFWYTDIYKNTNNFDFDNLFEYP